MSRLEKLRAMARVRDADILEWDRSSPAGDESAYNGDAAAEIPYDHSQFEKEE